MTRADRAEDLFRQGYKCSQSVFAAFADAVGMSTAQAAKLASPFGAGFGKLREVCGAVTGMIMVAGELSSPVSKCGRASAADTVGFYKRMGYDVIFIKR